MQRSALARLGLSTAIAATALAGLLAAPGSAAATVQNRCYTDGSLSLISGTIKAWLVRECINPESVTPLNITLQRYTPASDTWVTVATGRGTASYRCVGTTPSYFHMTALPNDYMLVNCV